LCLALAPLRHRSASRRGEREQHGVRGPPETSASSPAADLLHVGVIGRRSEYVGVGELDLFDCECELTLTPYRSR
jgi:hypothetical protein